MKHKTFVSGVDQRAISFRGKGRSATNGLGIVSPVHVIFNTMFLHFINS